MPNQELPCRADKIPKLPSFPNQITSSGISGSLTLVRRHSLGHPVPLTRGVPSKSHSTAPRLRFLRSSSCPPTRSGGDLGLLRRLSLACFPSAEMGFVSFVGRVLFASVFLLSAYQEFIEFGNDGGPTAKELKPKFDLVSKHIHKHLGFQIPEIEMKHVIASAISVRAFGGVLFIFGSILGANLLALYLAILTPIVFDFYNYDVEKPEFALLFVKFTQNLALLGALLFFVGMKTSVPRRTAKKKVPKTKTF